MRRSALSRFLYMLLAAALLASAVFFVQDTMPVQAQQQAPDSIPNPWAQTQAPGPVQDLALSTTPIADSLTINWTAPATGGAPTSYIVQVRKSNSSSAKGKRKTTTARNTAVTFNNMTPGKYNVWVRAQNLVGKSDRVVSTIELVPAVAPGPVTNMTVVAANNKVTVSWQPPETGGQPGGYIVHLKRQGAGIGNGKTKTPRAKKTAVTFTVDADGTYKVWVRAQNKSGKGERTHARITLPEAPPE